MSVLYLVRHGQATVDGDDYDHLSPLGFEQAEILGRHWAALGLSFDRLFIGPRLRHRQTFESAHQVYSPGSGSTATAWANVELLTQFDEHHGPEVVDHHRDSLGGGRDVSRAEDNTMKRFLQVFQKGSRLWVSGDLTTPEGLEPWPQFRSRIDEGLELVRQQAKPGERFCVFTSGGAVAAAVGTVLGLDDQKIIELSWRVQNASVTELHFSPRGYGLGRFNALPHFTEARLSTYI